MQGDRATGGFNPMSERTETGPTRTARTLTASEIRNRVEVIAEELALKIRPDHQGDQANDLSAYPIDTRKFVMLMSEFVRMN